MLSISSAAKPALVVLCLLLSFSGFSQTSGSGSKTDPYIIDLSSGSFYKSQAVNNATGYVLYKFHLPVSSTVNFSSCGSTIHTTVYVMTLTGSVLSLSNGYGVLCPAYQGSLTLTLAAGDYYYCESGYHWPTLYTGTVITNITCPPFTAGQEINTSFAQQMGQVFGSLEASRVPYGLLKDIALEQTDLSTFDGVLLADSNHVSMPDFRALYQTVISAQISSSAGTFSSMNSIDNIAQPLRNPGSVILYGLYYNYSKFTADAVSSGRISVVNNQVVDKYVSGNWQNPYETKTTLAVAPATDEVQGLAQQFTLPASLMLSNNFGQVSSIQFDAGDGAGYRTMSLGQAVPVNYSSTGTKELLFKFNLNNGTSLFSHSSLIVDQSLAGIYPASVQIPITTNEIYQGSPAQGYATILYANPARGMQNPVIVAEGFDPGTITNPENPLGLYNVYTFINNLPVSLSQILGPGGTYDLVFIDYKNGVDDIKRNALLLKEVVRRVNALKAQSGSTAQNVVLGLSMGGLVARWGLKDMENHGEAHQTRLYISYDSPQQGANVPIGYQFMANHLANLYVNSGIGIAGNVLPINSLKQVSNVLKLSSNPAARQMLIDYIDPNTGSLDNSVHNAWQSDLNAMGYPGGDIGRPLRRVAVSDGGECAPSQAVAPGNSLLSISGRANTRFLGDLVGNILFAPITGGTGRAAFALGIIPGSNRININVGVNTVANGGGNTVYTNHITFTKTILWLIPVTADITNVTKTAPGGLLPYDSYPGGYYIDGLNFNDSHEQNWFYKYNIQANHNQTFSFVPTASALDIGGGASVLTDADYTAKYVGSSPPAAPKNVPFANFTTSIDNSATNQPHIQFSYNNSNWVLSELNNISPIESDCTPLCSSMVINGPNQVCSGAPLTFSINSLPGTPVIWSTSPDLKVVSPNGSSTVTIAPTGTNNTDGSVSSITETIHTACGDQSLTSTLSRPSISMTGTTNGGCNGSVQSWILTATAGAPNATNWQWTVDNPTSLHCSFSNPNSPQTYASVTGGGGVTVKYTDQCGYIHSTGYTVYSNCGNLALSKNIYPNPSSSVVNVDFSENTAAGNAKVAQSSTVSIILPKTVTLYNMNSTVPIQTITQSQIIANGNKAMFKVAGLTSGIYFIHANYNDHVDQGTVQIN